MNAQTQTQPAADTRKLIPIKEATHMLGMKDVRVTKRLVLEGRLKSKVIGRNVLITRRSLDAFTDYKG